MLAMLADRTHQVYTGVSLIMAKGGQVHTRTFFEATDVTFYPISKEDLRSYAETGDSLDKAEPTVSRGLLPFTSNASGETITM